MSRAAPIQSRTTPAPTLLRPLAFRPPRSGATTSRCSRSARPRSTARSRFAPRARDSARRFSSEAARAVGFPPARGTRGLRAAQRVEIELFRFVARDNEHVSYERVCSGIGLVNCYRFLASLEGGARLALDAATLSAAATDGSDETEGAALGLMISIYGAEAGNLALKTLATGGVYLGGGIPPKILPKLREGGFLQAFLAKGRFAPLLERVPVRVILNDRTALIGAALAVAS